MPGAKEMDLTTAWKVIQKRESHDGWKVNRALGVALEAIMANMKESLVPDIKVSFVDGQWMGVDAMGERPILEILEELRKRKDFKEANLALRVLKGVR